jgi:hypothetical protein
MILEDKVAEVLESGGFLSPFVDYKGIEQPAPKLVLINFDETDPSITGKRVLFIRKSGGNGGNKFVQREGLSIYFIGLQDKSDSPTVAEQADSLLTYLLETRENCGIIDIDPISGTSPVMFTDAGRPLVEIQTTVLIDRGIK